MKKIVYFDEGSVTDYMQIVQEGNMSKTTELLNQTQRGIEASGSAEVKLNPFASLLTAIAGFSANVAGKTSLTSAANTDKIAKTIIQNTLLTDFLDICDKEKSQIRKFKDYILSEPKGSLTELLKMSVYTNMMNGSTALDSSDDIELNINKFDETIKLAKGYFEFIGICETKNVVFRFNLDALRNNYRSSDLTRMNLVIYAINVGEISLQELNFSEEMKKTSKITEQPRYFSNQKIEEDADESEKQFKMYDVLLAGVE